MKHLPLKLKMLEAIDSVYKNTYLFDKIIKFYIVALKKYNDQTLAEVLQQIIEEKNWKAKLYQTKIKEIWLLNMGTTIASYTKELKLRRKKLFIGISSASLRQELSYSKEKIITLMNEGLGEEYITDVVIR